MAAFNYGFFRSLRQSSRFLPETATLSEDTKPCRNPVTIPYREVSGLYLPVFKQIRGHFTTAGHFCQLFSAIYTSVNKDFPLFLLNAGNIFSPFGYKNSWIKEDLFI
jgi:hypothetical protein